MLTKLFLIIWRIWNIKATEFCYWLQGLFELSDELSLSKRQADIIKTHLNMVFVHDIDPSYPKEQQNKLDYLHNEGVILDSSTNKTPDVKGQDK